MVCCCGAAQRTSVSEQEVTTLEAGADCEDLLPLETLDERARAFLRGKAYAELTGLVPADGQDAIYSRAGEEG